MLPPRRLTLYSYCFFVLYCLHGIQWCIMDAEELLEKYARRGERKFHSEDIRGVDLESADLSGIDFKNANLIGANLNNANLSKANLEKTNLTRASLINANLGELVNSYYLNLTGAELSSSNLRNANLESANLRNANLESVNLQKAC